MSQIRSVREEEFAEFVGVLEHAAGRHVTPTALTDAVGSYPLDRLLAVVVDGRIVAGTGSDQLELTVPGPRMLPVARATLTGVLPTERGRGHATALLVGQLHDLRSRGEVMMVATTSTSGLVSQIGYGPASQAVELQLAPAEVRLDPGLPEAAGRLRHCGPEEIRSLLPVLFDRHRRAQPGQVLRRQEFWAMWFLDRPLYRIGGSERFVVVYEDSGGSPQGYLSYRLTSGELRRRPVAELVLEDLVAAGEQAQRELWRFCLTFTQAEAVRVVNASAELVPRWMLRESSGLRVNGSRDFLWLRLLDVPAALRARRYAADGRVVLEVRDEQLPANSGRFELESAEGAASCRPSRDEPDVVAGVGAVAATYLGGTSWSTLARAGTVQEVRPGAASRVDALFHTDRPPWTVTDW